MSEIPDLTPGSVVFLHDYVTGLSFSKLSFKYTKSASLKFIINEKNNIEKPRDKYLWIKIFPNSNCVDFRGMTLRMLLANYLILTVTRCYGKQLMKYFYTSSHRNVFCDVSLCYTVEQRDMACSRERYWLYWACRRQSWSLCYLNTCFWKYDRCFWNKIAGQILRRPGTW